jgi:hypothetical protein
METVIPEVEAATNGLRSALEIANEKIEKSQEMLESIQRGLEQSANDETQELGSFAEYVDTEEDRGFTAVFKTFSVKQMRQDGLGFKPLSAEVGGLEQLTDKAIAFLKASRKPGNRVDITPTLTTVKYESFTRTVFHEMGTLKIVVVDRVQVKRLEVPVLDEEQEGESDNFPSDLDELVKVEPSSVQVEFYNQPDAEFAAVLNRDHEELAK